jgi:hypothetical protein
LHAGSGWNCCPQGLIFRFTKPPGPPTLTCPAVDNFCHRLEPSALLEILVLKVLLQGVLVQVAVLVQEGREFAAEAVKSVSVLLLAVVLVSMLMSVLLRATHIDVCR